MGHYDKPTWTAECERCGDVISYRHSAPTYCSGCREDLREPHNVETEVDVDVKRDTSEIVVTVSFVNNNRVSISPGVSMPNNTEHPLGIVGYLQLKNDKGMARGVWLQNSHQMDVGRRFKIMGTENNAVSNDNTRSMTFRWTLEDGITQEKCPSAKYVGEVGKEFRKRAQLSNGKLLDGEDVTVSFEPTNNEWFDSAEVSEDVPSFLIDI